MQAVKQVCADGQSLSSLSDELLSRLLTSAAEVNRYGSTSLKVFNEHKRETNEQSVTHWAAIQALKQQVETTSKTIALLSEDIAKLDRRRYDVLEQIELSVGRLDGLAAAVDDLAARIERHDGLFVGQKHAWEIRDRQIADCQRDILRVCDRLNMFINQLDRLEAKPPTLRARLAAWIGGQS